MLEQIPVTRHVTVRLYKGYDTRDFVAEYRQMQVTPHVTQNVKRNGDRAVPYRRRRCD